MKTVVQEIADEKFSLARSLKLLNISKSFYYYKNYSKEETTKNDEELLKRIKRIVELKPFWGYRRIWANINKEFKKEGKIVKKGTIQRLMRENGLCVQKPKLKATRSNDLSKKKPVPTTKNKWWGIDMTKFLLANGVWLYLIIVIDWYNKKIIGYNVDTRCKSSDWGKALDMAVLNATENGSRDLRINLMSDNGCQPTSNFFIKLCKDLGINQAFTSFNNPKGNADTERLMRTLKEDYIWLSEWETITDANQGVVDMVNHYNNDYLHSSLNYLSPVEFDRISSFVVDMSAA